MPDVAREEMKLTSIALAVDGGALCRECGTRVSRLDIPILVATAIPMPAASATTQLRAGTPVQRPCDHKLPVTSRIVATIHDDATPVEPAGDDPLFDQLMQALRTRNSLVAEFRENIAVAEAEFYDKAGEIFRKQRKRRSDAVDASTGATDANPAETECQ